MIALENILHWIQENSIRNENVGTNREKYFW